MAEKTSTTPAEIIQDISVGEMIGSSVLEPDRTVLRLFFVWRSLLCSRAFLFAVEACFGEDGGLLEDPETGALGCRVEGDVLVSLSVAKCDPETKRKLVGWVELPNGRSLAG